MFKGVLSSFNGSLDSATAAVSKRNKLKQQENVDEISSIKSNDSEITMTNTQIKTKSQSNKLISVKRSRKKLTSMVSKLRSSVGRQSNGVPVDENSDKDDHDDDDDDDNRNQNVANYRVVHDDEDDDDAYKSAEEACRKMSINETAAATAPQDPSKTKSLGKKFLGNKRGGRKSSTSMTAPPPLGQVKETASYEQLIEDKKYILPEEQCDIPTFLHTKNCDPYLIEETRKLLKERFAKNPESFYDADYKRMLTDDWTVSRFLLRRRLDPKRTAKLMEECGRFRKQYKMSEVMLWEFPMEFHKAGGLFKYKPDRVGNVTMYMRVKMYRRVPEISDVFKAFILCVLEQCDVANNGRGTAVVFDLSGCGLQNVDLGFLSWLLSSFRNYCPKGVSYIIVYNLPWILNATCKLAMTWMSSSNKRALRFVYGDEIENFIEKSHLPDYLGGTCKQNYRAIPKGSKAAIEICDRLDMTREQAIKIRELFKEYLSDDNEDQVDAEEEEEEEEEKDDDNEIRRNSSVISNQTDETKSHYDDAKSSMSQDEIIELDSSPSINSNAHVPVVDLVSRASKFITH